MKQCIGFATEFYTLWEIWQTPVYSGNVVMNGVPPQQIGINHEYYYIKNISKDLEKAKAAYPGVDVDEELRGQTRSFERFEKMEYPSDCFSFGKCAGEPICASTDVWQLKRAMWIIVGQTGESNKRKRVLARRRLIELGELLKYPHFIERLENVDWGKRDANDNCLPDNEQVVKYRVSYATPKFIEIDEAKKIQAAQPYYFIDGEKVTLKVKEVKAFGFETQFGYTSVRIYETEDGKTVKYVGASPVAIGDGYKEIKATVKHKEFRGNKETHLLRIKCL